MAGFLEIPTAEALTFDDVLLAPGHSEVLPAETSIASRVTNALPLNIPILSAAMDTVTEAPLAIAMAQAGGIGVIHRSMAPEDQAAAVRQVKKFESGMIVDPLVIGPDATLRDALTLMERSGISGIPVVENGGTGGQIKGRLVGIVTNRDVRFASDPDTPVHTLMTANNLVTVRDGVDQDEAKRLLHQHRIEKLLVVDEAGHCTGLVTVKDMEKARAHPDAVKDAHGRLRVAAATTTDDQGLERVEALVDAGVDLVVIDTAHGHSERVLATVRRVKQLSNQVQVLAGNVATADGTKALIDAGADAVKVGIGPGSICTTRVVAGVGMPQLTAVMEAARAASGSDTPVVADGGREVLRRSCQGACRRCVLRHGRVTACGHHGGAGRGLSSPGPQLQGVSRHGIDRRHGTRLRRSVLSGRGARYHEARSGRDRGAGPLSRAGGGCAPSARGRAALRHGLCRRAGSGGIPEPGPFRANYQLGPCGKPRA